MLTDKEKYRYSRHLSLNQVGLTGQEKLKAAKVLVVGAGGLSCPILQYLTAAGIGNIGIIDFDEVDETNLQRQVLFNIADVGTNKAIAAKQHLEQLNNYVNFDIYPKKLTTQNALQLFTKYDIIVDGTDNFSTRYLINDASVICNKPLVYGAIYKFEGQVTVFNYKNGPSYRCLFPEPPQNGATPNCSEIGVIGVLPGIIGTQQANEVIKLILKIGEPLAGNILTYNALDNSFIKIKIEKSAEEIEKVINNAANFKAIDYDLFCGIKKEKNMQEIDIDKLKEWYKDSENFTLVDVREKWEQPRVEKENVMVAPLGNLQEFISKIPTEKKVVIICQHGIRSVAAIEHLQKEHHFKNLINLEGGIENW